MTWFHELGHVVYARIDKDQVAKLATAAKEKFPVVSGGDPQGAVDPNTMQLIALPEASIPITVKHPRRAGSALHFAHYDAPYRRAFRYTES